MVYHMACQISTYAHTHVHSSFCGACEEGGGRIPAECEGPWCLVEDCRNPATGQCKPSATVSTQIHHVYTYTMHLLTQDSIIECIVWIWDWELFVCVWGGGGGGHGSIPPLNWHCTNLHAGWWWQTLWIQSQGSWWASPQCNTSSMLISGDASCLHPLITPHQ